MFQHCLNKYKSSKKRNESKLGVSKYHEAQPKQQKITDIVIILLSSYTPVAGVESKVGRT